MHGWRSRWACSASSNPDRASSLGLLFGAMVLLAMVLGPCNTVMANVVPANQRAAGYALYIFLIHLFGDISSPILLGCDLDLLRQAERGRTRRSARFFAVDRRVRRSATTNLTVAMLAVVPGAGPGLPSSSCSARATSPPTRTRAADAGDEPTPDGSAFCIERADDSVQCRQRASAISRAIRRTTVISRASMRWPPACWIRRS